MQRAAVAMLAALATVAGMLMAVGPAGAQASALAGVAGSGLPHPGPLLRAPQSLAAAEIEVRSLLAQVAAPKTALLGTLRLLLNAGVGVFNGNTRVYAGRRGGPPMFLQVGEVVALSRDITGHQVGLKQFAGVIARANSPAMRRYFTSNRVGAYFASTITGASNAAEFLWAATVLESGSAGQAPLLKALAKAGTSRLQLSPLQMQFMSLRMQSDALVIAGYEARRMEGHAVGLAFTRLLSAANSNVPCDFGEVPDLIVEGGSAWYGHLNEAMIKAINSAKAAEAAEAYSVALAWATIVVSAATTALMISTLRIDTPTKDGFVRTKTQDTKTPGNNVEVKSTFSYDTGNFQWLNCARLILIRAGLATSKIDNKIKNANVKWAVESGPASFNPATGVTSDQGVATTHVIGDPQPKALTDPLPYTRDIDYNVTVNPLAARNAWELVAHYVLLAGEAAWAARVNPEIAGIVLDVQLSGEAAIALGVLTLPDFIIMTDWHDGNQMPTAFSASITFDDPETSCNTCTSGSGSVTIPRQTIGYSSVVIGGYASPGSGFWLGGSVSFSYNDPSFSCGGLVPCSYSGPPDDSLSDAVLDIRGDQPEYSSFEIGVVGTVVGCPPQVQPYCSFSEELHIDPQDAANIYQYGNLKSTLNLENSNNQVVGSVSFTWYYD